MNPVAFILHYLGWHYSRGILDILRVWGNFMWLPLHFFSTGALLKTWITPFNRLEEKYPEKGHFDPEFYAGTILVNLIMRMIGFIVRTVFIVISLLGLLFSFSVGLFFLAFWIVAPVGIFVTFSIGLGLAFS